MDFLTSDTFVTVVTVVASAAGLFWALRTDLGKRIDRVKDDLIQRIDTVKDDLGRRIDKVEKDLIKRIDTVKDDLGRRIDMVKGDLGQRVDTVKEDLGQRINRQADRAHADHKELVAKIGEVQTAVRVLDGKLEERSSPRRLMVQEPSASYAVEDEMESDPKAEECDPKYPTDNTVEDATADTTRKGRRRPVSLRIGVPLGRTRGTTGGYRTAPNSFSSRMATGGPSTSRATTMRLRPSIVPNPSRVGSDGRRPADGVESAPAPVAVG